MLIEDPGIRQSLWMIPLTESTGARGILNRAAAVVAIFFSIALGFTTNSSFAEPAGTIHYPELRTPPPSNVGIEYDPATGRRLLRFSNAIANLGAGPLEVIPTNNAVTGTTDAYQRLYSHDDAGNWYVASTVYVGTFELHPQHDHWHLEDFSRYELHNLAPDGSVGSTVLASSQKVSFCLADVMLVDSGLEHVGSETYSLFACGQTDPQGVSVGWADVYPWNIYGQSLDITGLPDGDYWLVSTADPDNFLDEGGGAAESNNTGAVRVRIGSEFVWVDDAVPEGAYTDEINDPWTWVSSDPSPFSGSLAHQSTLATGLHQHFFDWAAEAFPVNAGNTLFAYAYLDPVHPPSEVMLEWSDGLNWEHRAYWGANLIDAGLNRTPSRLWMGPLPPAGQWVRLEVPANRVGLEGVGLWGMSFTLFDGRATWDYAGVYVGPNNPPFRDVSPPAVAMTAPADHATVSGQVALSADVTDNVGVSGVQFTLDGANLGLETATPPYTMNWDTSSTSNGSHNLSALARDLAGNSAASAPVTIVVSNGVPAGDPTPPVCNAGGPYFVECQSPITNLQLDGSNSSAPGGGVLIYAWTTDCPDAGFDDPASPTPILLVNSAAIPRECKVTLEVTNDAGSSSRSSTTLTTVDTTPPAINCPAGIVATTDPGQCSAAVNFAIMATDNCSDTIVVCNPPPGSIFPTGVTSVECAATDAAGHESRCFFTVTVNDPEGPRITCPADIATPADPGKCTANVTFQPTPADNCADVTLRCVPPSGTDFPIGVSMVTCTATDPWGGTAQDTFIVTVSTSAICPLPHGFWKSHPGALPLTGNPMILGGRDYTISELPAILSAPTAADASLILARQLIAATLNTANGSDPRPACDAISQANNLLSGFSGKLPYKVPASSIIGNEMLNLAKLLSEYNSGSLTPECAR